MKYIMDNRTLQEAINKASGTMKDMSMETSSKIIEFRAELGKKIIELIAIQVARGGMIIRAEDNEGRR